jgi:hypothetical protein
MADLIDRQAPKHVFVEICQYGLPQKVWAGGDVDDCVKYVRADIAALPAHGVRVPTVDELAQIIRKVDGQNSLGAGELAEAILAALEPAEAGGVEAMAAENQKLQTKVLQYAVAMERAERITRTGQPDKIDDAGAILRAALAALRGGVR